MISSRISKIVLLSILTLAFVLPIFFNFAQEENLEEICQLEKIEEQGKILSKEDYRKLLEKCQGYYEEKSGQIEQDISKTEKEKRTLQNQIAILKNQIKKLDYQISQSNLMIEDLKLQIGDTENSIKKNSEKIDDFKKKLINILRLIYEEDQRSLVEILLVEPKLSNFFDNLMALEKISSKNQELLKEIKALKSYLEEQKTSLDTEKGELGKALQIQTLQKQENEGTKKEKDYFLKLTETEYQKYLKEKEETQKRVAEIRKRVFELIGIPEAPTFGEAYEIAKYVASLTGIRPAFLLAILQQESAIGRNVGQCYLKNTNSGDGIRISTGVATSRVMKPGRDIPHFLTITQGLGRDPYNTPVSCPMSFGWGGAMGPAQFIPATWMLYKDRLEGIIGKTADPWSVKDSFLAAGLYLSDYGAKSKTKDGEWKAAMIYFSGSTTKSAFYWYANNVLKIADGFEKDIEIIEKSR